MALDSLERELGMDKRVQLVPKPMPSPKTEPRREAAGQKLPQKEFRAPLIETLRELDGSAHVSEIRPVLEKKVQHLLGEADHELVTNGDPRWWNAACWERDAMVKDGILATGSKRGYWELSEMSMRTKDELDAMEPAAFAKWASEHLAIDKPDFRPVRQSWSTISRSALRRCSSSSRRRRAAWSTWSRPASLCARGD
jgi:Mrr N-terminal domain